MPGTGSGVEGRAVTRQRVTDAVGCPKSAASVARRHRRTAIPIVPDVSAASWRRREAVIDRRATSATTAAQPTVPQAFLGAGEHRLLVAGLDMDHPVGIEPGLAQGRVRTGRAGSRTTARRRWYGRRCRPRTKPRRHRRQPRQRHPPPHAGRRAPARLRAGARRWPPRRTAARPGAHGFPPRSGRCVHAACRMRDEAAWSSGASWARRWQMFPICSL